MIRITNSTIYDRVTSQLTQQQARLAITQEKISSGKNFLRPSDAPDQVAALERLESTVRQTGSYTNNIGRIKDKLNFQETAINSINDELIRAKELLIQGANGTLSADQRNTLSIELNSILDSMIAIGNQKDADGSFLFSGSSQLQKPYDSLGNFQGNDDRQAVNIDEGYLLEVGLPGSSLFASFKDNSDAASDVFTVLKQSITALQSDDLEGIQDGIDNVEIAFNHVNVKLAQVGSKMRVVENQLNVLEDRSLTLESAISQVEELDYVKAVSELKNQSLALQAGQSSFAQISGLSLFNYIK